MTELERARSWPRGARDLEANRRRIDDLNVYPVPDGDTGTNLTLTVRAIVEALEASTAAERAAVAKELSRAALMGARGNSGVIFSQIVRGAADVLGEPGAIDATRIAPRVPRRERRGLPRGAPAGRGDDADRHPRAGRGGRGPRYATLAAAELLRRSSARARTRSRGRRSSSRCCARRASSTPAAPACSRSSAALAAALAGEPLPDAPVDDGRARASTRSTRSCRGTATAPSSWSRARRSTPTRSRPSSSGSATRCSSSATRPR